MTNQETLELVKTQLQKTVKESQKPVYDYNNNLIGMHGESGEYVFPLTVPLNETEVIDLTTTVSELFLSEGARNNMSVINKKIDISPIPETNDGLPVLTSLRMRCEYADATFIMNTIND